MKDLSNENIIHIKKEGIQYLQFKRLLEYKDKIQHCYTLKDIDVKNKSKESEDYKKICNALNLNNENIVHPKQTHTDIVKNVNESNTSADFIEVDGLITNKQNKILSLVFADCTPLFLYDPAKNVIGNIHSGWRGTVQKIAKKAMQKMNSEYGCNPQDIICCIGPTIRKCHFKVDDDVKDIFMQAFNDESIIEKGEVIEGKQKYYIDAVQANINMLKECGLKEENIIDSGICTVCNCEIMHSYRAEKEQSGRNAAIMGKGDGSNFPF
ncbi:MAG: peptidoglycan editing factor PgeF [Clostridia bacterium]|nr:peptidoglycan editing factor PgeF [Clostridia bacterium]